MFVIHYSQNHNIMTDKLTLTKAALDAAPHIKDVFELPAVRNNWIGTYQKTTGKTDGELRFEAEKVLFMQTVSENKQLAKCDRFSLYGCLIELAISGLTLRDGISYIIPYKDKATFMPGWKGRLEQINQLPNVIHCHEPQVVYDCDIFELEKGERLTIKKHTPGVRTKTSKITDVYFVIQFTHGVVVYHMNAIDVENIRDNYSQSYKQYIKALQSPENKGKNIGDKLTIKYQGGSFESDDLPMWISDEAQAFKKTIVKRVYGALPKLPQHQLIDDKIKAFAAENKMNPEAIDADENNKHKPGVEETYNAAMNLADKDTPGTIDTEHEEVTDDKQNTTASDDNDPNKPW